MIRFFLACCATVVLCGCSGPTFTNLGNGVGVPTESIDDYAESNNLSRDEAKKRMLEEFSQKTEIQNNE